MTIERIDCTEINKLKDALSKAKIPFRVMNGSTLELDTSNIQFAQLKVLAKTYMTNSLGVLGKVFG
jgi:hypothetical protein